MTDREMCDLVAEYANKKAAKAAEKAKANALRLFQNGGSYEFVRASILSLTDEELKEIYQKAMEG